MKTHNTKMKGKKALSMLLALVMVLSVASPAFSEMLGVTAKAASKFEAELAFNNLFVFEKWANDTISGKINPDLKNNGSIVTNIETGSFIISNNQPVDDNPYNDEIFNGVTDSADTAYSIPVEGNTSYTLSYDLTASYRTDFEVIVFYYKANGEQVTTRLDSFIPNVANSENIKVFTTPADAAYIQLRFDNNKPGTTVTVKDIAVYKTELHPQNNLFDFDGWASNANTPKPAVLYDYDGGTVKTNTAEESITLTTADGSAYNTIYTNFTLYPLIGFLPEDNGYYTIDVKPNAAYTVSYNLTDCNLLDFQVWIARYKTKEAGEEYDSCLYYTSFNATQLNGYNSFSFTTNSETDYIQIVFASNHGGNVGLSGTVKDIAVCETENLFDLSDWVNSSCVNSFYGNGTVTLETTSTDGISFATNETVSTSAPFLSGVELGTAVTNCYTMDVDPNTTYTFHYNLTDGVNFSHPVYFQPFVAWVENGVTSVWVNYETINWGYNQFSFTTPDKTDRIQVVFCIYDPSVTCNVRDIVIQKSEFEENTGYPHRTYYPEGSESYGELPTPSNIPEGQVFAGWYTGENGEGRYIAPNSEVHYSSLTVYPKFEPEVTSLRVVSYPKTTYDIGEKFNPTGLALEATAAGGSTFTITSGYRYTPEYASTQAGNQNITISYGGATCTLPITVSAGAAGQLTVNGEPVDVTIANNEYTLNDYTDNKEFNRYELAYISDSYVKGTITWGQDENGKDISEDFFLEPSDEGTFASYIDGYITKNDNGTFDDPSDDYLETETRSGIQKIKFTFLDKDFGKFELLSLTTIDVPELSDSMVYKENGEYKVGIDLAFGGVVSYIEDLDDDVRARIYETGANNPNGSKQYITRVDYENLLESGHAAESEAVNLINTFDRGRYLQQSYYGTDQPPFEMGSYNGEPWSYNPVQGGNIRDKDTGYGNEASKIIDYRKTDKELYIKTRPLDWGKNSIEYEDSYITDSYMEAWYVFEDGMIKTYCRFVDFSGYPSNFTDQELPALYTIEPLNHLVYYGSEKSEEKVKEENITLTEKGEDNPEFWGVSSNYNAYHKDNPQEGDISYPLDNDRYCSENWAAFTASSNADSFGIGVYSPGVTDFTVGTYPQIYNTIDNGDRTYTETTNKNYRHAQSVNPSAEDPTSYIAPVDQMTFESYKPYEYSYYVTTGTAAKIREDFNSIADKDAQAERDKTRVAVPETVYLNPADNKDGKIYVNNIMDTNNYYNVITEAKAEADMYFGLRVKNAKTFEVNVTNITDSTNDIVWVDKNGNGESKEIDISTGMYIAEYGGSLSLTRGLNHGETATAKWDILVYLKDGTTENYTAYTVLYAPERTVGAVAESHTNNNSLNEVSSWITGANGIDHSKRSPLGGFHGDIHDSGYFKQDPLYSDIQTTGGESHNSHDYITTDHPSYAQNPDNADDGSENAYVLQTATDEDDGSRAQSYLGLLTVDGSRYTNTNQIPNFKIGYDALRHGTNDKDSYNSYATYYTLGSDESFITTEDVKLNEKPSGFTTHTSYSRPENLSPKRDTVVPSYNVSEINNMYIHAIAQAESYQYGVIYNWRNYATAGTSVLCSVTDKGELRDSVLDGYTKDKADYSEAAYNKFATELEEAAEVLGDPSATKEEIDNAKKELNEAKEKLTNPYFALKYDNLFSALEFSQNLGSMTMVQARSTVEYNMENASIIINSNGTQGSDIYNQYGSENPYYNVVLEPSKEYVFEYDVKSDEGSQMLLHFYDANGAGVSVTDRSIQVDSSAPTPVDKTDTHFASYTNAADSHIVMRFKTPENVAKVAFRFGNTNNINNESTFSNIRLVEARKYYADVEYPKTEDVFKENISYGTLPTLTRTGYTFKGWSDVNDIGITEATQATEHRTIYSQWNEHTYTITFNANGGSGTIAQINAVPYSRTETLPESGFTLNGFKLIGWSTKSGTNSVEYALGEKVSGLTAENGGNVILYAVWAKSEINVTFDNLFDLSQVIDSLDNEFVDVTDKTYTGFTLKAVSESKDNDCYPKWTYDIPVKPNTTYTFTADIEHIDGNPNNGTGYEIFVGVKLEDGTLDTDEVLGENCNPEGSYFKTINKSTFTFTTSSDSAYVSLRFDVNDYQSVMTVENIRLWEADGTSVSPVNKFVGNGNQYGALADATRTGYIFDGWYTEPNGQGEKIEPTKVMDSTETVNLYSHWTEIVYTVNYSNNGAADVNVEKHNISSIGYTGDLELPTPTCDYAEFVGWSFNDLQNPYDKDGVYEGGTNMKISDFPADKLNPDENGTPVIQLHAVWKIKSNAFVDDTVISDFGVMMPVNSRENDKGIVGYHSGAEFGGTLEVGLGSVDKKTFEGKYGTFEIYKDGEDNYTQYVAYTPKKIVDTLDSNGVAVLDTVTYCGQITYPDGSKSEIFTNTIIVVPASNTLYEENVVKTTVETPATYQWNKKGSSTIAMQDFSTDEDIYGKDSAYATSTGFSDGTYLRADVTPDNKKSDTATFTFTGSGFDLISACGTNTGVQIVKISKLQSDGNYKALKSIIVDTYFTDTSIMNGDLLHQVPVVNYRGDYGTYKVETTATYLNSAGAVKKGTATIAYSSAFGDGTSVKTGSGEPSKALLKELEELGFEDLGNDIEVIWMDDNSAFNGGSGSPNASIFSGSAKVFYADGETVTGLRNYIDCVRIYNPLNGGNGYYKDSEQNATYYNIVEELELDSSAEKNMAYIESTDAGFSLNFGTDFNFDAYNQQGGPKGEIYLKSGDAIAFKFTAETNGDVAYAMLGMRAVKGTANASVYTDASKATPYSQAISSATEMYYDVSSAVTVVNGEVTIVVANTGEEGSILAVNNLKLVNGNLADENEVENPLSGSVANGNVSSVPTPVVPEAVQGEEGNVEDNPETDVDTDTNIPETDTEVDAEDGVEDGTENNISVAIPGLPAPIASFLEMLFKLLGQLVGSLGF